MKNFSLFVVSLIAFILSMAQGARAGDVGLDFSLPSTQVVAQGGRSPTSQQQISTTEAYSLVADSVELSFAPDALPIPAKGETVAEISPPLAPIQVVSATPHVSATPQDMEVLFSGGSDSLVAKAVGSAEGTRTPDGGKTWAYGGHSDPGNGVWNLGTFSYQHGANSPEEADAKQLQRLRGQAQMLREKAATRGMSLSLEEELNGIDLANQSPRAALSRGGYIDRLDQAHQMGLKGSEAVLWARTRSYTDPDTGRWNAPGLGNTGPSITRDQERRRKAIEAAIAAQQSRGILAPLPAEPTLESAISSIEGPVEERSAELPKVEESPPSLRSVQEEGDPSSEEAADQETEVSNSSMTDSITDAIAEEEVADSVANSTTEEEIAEQIIFLDLPDLNEF